MTIDHSVLSLGTETATREPARLIRVASVARAMLEEARHSPCDGPDCERFRAIYERTVDELGALPSEELNRRT